MTPLGIPVGREAFGMQQREMLRRNGGHVDMPSLVRPECILSMMLAITPASQSGVGRPSVPDLVFTHHGGKYYLVEIPAMALAKLGDVRAEAGHTMPI